MSAVGGVLLMISGLALAFAPGQANAVPWLAAGGVGLLLLIIGGAMRAGIQ